MKEELKFETFTEFCSRADELLKEFKTAIQAGKISIKEYQDYIYNQHSFSENIERDLLAKDKCWMWVLSYKYEPMAKNDLYSTLGYLKKGR